MLFYFLMPPKKQYRKKKGKPFAKHPVDYKKGKVSTTVKKYVRRAIASSSEEKYCEGEPWDNENLLEVTAVGGAYARFVATIGGVLDVAQGTAQDQRIGNEIILKKWILKFAFTPALGVVPAYITSPQLFVDLYIGYRKDMQPIQNPPQGFFQNGNSSYSPTGSILDRLAWINKDAYHICYKRRFKVGMAAPDASFAPYNGLSNNDFPMVYQFQLDLCNFGFRNLKLKYNDGALSPQNAKVNALTVWCLPLNANGQPLVNTAIGLSTYDVSMTNNILFTDS